MYDIIAFLPNGLMMTVLLVTLMLFLVSLRKSSKWITKWLPPTSSEKTVASKVLKKQRPVVICPFSQGSDFMVETADHLPLTPLETYEDWVLDYQHQKANAHDDDDSTTGCTLMPLAARWLNMGMSGQDTPGILRAGLRRLKNTKFFLVEEPHRLQYELSLKKKALDDPQRHPFVFVAQPESLNAQRECLDLFLEYLPRRYPEEYVYDNAAKTITVKCIDTTFHVKDWYDTRPLELCERIVQEDLCLMRPPTPEGEAAGESYRMAAAAVIFSFEELPEKLGQPMEFLHAPWNDHVITWDSSSIMSEKSGKDTNLSIGTKAKHSPSSLSF
jgi:hypothetical protein